MHKISKGILITIEGIDGCGKSTLIQALKQLLNDLPIICTKEPGETTLGKHLLALLPDVQQQTPLLDFKAEFLLFAADRAQHVAEIVKPALVQKKIVISNRFTDSSLVYQGYVRGLDITMIKSINDWATQSIKPDLTLFITIPPEGAYQRIQDHQAPLSAFGKEKISFMQHVADGYNRLFKERTNVITLDGTQTAEQLTKQAVHIIRDWLKKQNYYA